MNRHLIQLINGEGEILGLYRYVGSLAEVDVVDIIERAFAENRGRAQHEIDDLLIEFNVERVFATEAYAEIAD